MSTKTTAAQRRAGVDWRRAEFVLTLLACVGFITLPIRITTVYGGLFMHVPVILIPTTIVAAIVFVIKPQWLTRIQAAHAGPGGPGERGLAPPPGTGIP